MIRDGGFVLCCEAQFSDFPASFMASTCYVPASLKFDYDVRGLAISRYIDACRVVSVAEEIRSLINELLRDLMRAKYKGVSKLQMRVKTHKDSGEVVPRLLHGNSRSPFEPGARLVAKWLRPAIDRMQHLFRDSVHLDEL